MTTNKPGQGLLIVFEGIDGTGKSTQVQRVAQALASQNIETVALREPTDGVHGREIRRMAAEGRADATRELALFMDDRREDVQQNILPALARGAVVLLDRYYYSTMAYQGARGLDARQILAENETFAPAPDLLVIMELPVEEALRRVKASRSAGPDEFEHAEYLALVKQHFDRIDHPNLLRLDARQTPEDLARQVVAAIQSLLERQ